MKVLSVVLLAALAAGPVALAPESALAQAAGGAEVEQQAPVEEGMELPDSPTADEAQGNAEAQMPAVEQDDSSEVDEPAVEDDAPVDQPAVEP